VCVCVCVCVYENAGVRQNIPCLSLHSQIYSVVNGRTEGLFTEILNNSHTILDLKCLKSCWVGCSFTQWHERAG
jgi:hypothetical protein